MAQEMKQYKNAVYVSVGAFMVSQKNYYYKPPIAEVRPAVSVQYNRVLWRGLGISAGYAFKRANPNARGIEGTKIDCTEQTHAILVAPNYRFDIKQFNITPYFAMGVCFANFRFPILIYGTHPPRYYNYITKSQSCFMISPGIRFGYDIKRWNIFLSYSYDYFRYDKGVIDHPLNFYVIGGWNFPKSFGHHCFNIGAGIKF